MYRFLTGIIIFLIIITSACVLMVKPKLHKPVFVYNLEYKLNTKPQEIDEDMFDTMPLMSLEEPVETTQKVFSSQQNTQSNYSKLSGKDNSGIKTTTKTLSTENKRIEPKSYFSRENNRLESQQTTVNSRINSEPITSVQTNVQAPLPTASTTENVKPQTSSGKTTVSNSSMPVLTEEEEKIQWNIWRSNLQNQIMRDVKLPTIPDGTVFKFSFDLDKYGRITNLKTWSLTPAHNPEAIQYIAPVIKSYQGKSILNFPYGSKRVVTTVQGGWKISKTQKYSTPNDYKDVETVKR